MATKKLRLSADLELPLDFSTAGVAVIGMRGSGKSNTQVRFAEVLFDAGIPWVAIDPKGDWWGVRSSADGKSEGLSVPIFGGLHGDAPLEAGTGARMADLLVDENLSAILDVSHLSKTGELPTFLTPFCNQLMHRHQLDPHVRTVILEEAHRYIPQQVPSEKAAMKEAAAALLLEGRSFGLGCWAATQRPARLNKDVLEEVGNAIIFRLGVAATNDKKAVKSWVDHYELGGEIVASLTKLVAGQGWVLMPEDGVVKKVQMDRRTTFDSGGTPKVGTATRRPATLADVDMGAIKEKLDDVIERAKADDPTELRRQIAALRKQLNERPTEKVVETITEAVEVPVLGQDAVEALRAASGALLLTREVLDAAMKKFATPDVKRVKEVRPPTATRVAPARPLRERPQPAPSSAVGVDEGLTGPQQRVLDALAWWEAVGFPQPTKLQVGAIAGYRVSKKVGGAFGNILGGLRSAELIVYPSAGTVALTSAGHALSTAADIELTTKGLQRAVMAQLTDPERRVLQPIIDAYPDALTKQEAGAAAGYLVSDKVGGAFGNILGRLRSLGLVDYPAPGMVAAEPVLFLDDND